MPVKSSAYNLMIDAYEKEPDGIWIARVGVKFVDTLICSAEGATQFEAIQRALYTLCIHLEKHVEKNAS